MNFFHNNEKLFQSDFNFFIFFSCVARDTIARATKETQRVGKTLWFFADNLAFFVVSSAHQDWRTNETAADAAIVTV